MKGAKINILDAIGNTPIVRLNKVATGVQSEIYVKLDFLNPGGSIKDRIGAYILEQAVKNGDLKPGGTVIEGTSGNTGVGLAMYAAVHGYKCVFVLADKQSKEKIDNLRAFGAKVIVCPTNVEPEDQQKSARWPMLQSRPDQTHDFAGFPFADALPPGMPADASVFEGGAAAEAVAPGLPMTWPTKARTPRPQAPQLGHET